MNQGQSVPAAQPGARHVSQNVVDTSRLPQPLAKVAPSVDDDAQSLGVIAAPAADETQAHTQTQTQSQTHQSSEIGTNNTTNSVAPAHIPVVEETTNSSSSSSSNNNSSNNNMKVEAEADADDHAHAHVDEAENAMDNETKSGAGNESAMSDDDESEYEYEDDDDAAFTGFLVTDNTYGAASSSSGGNESSNGNTGSNDASASGAPARIVEEETPAASAASSPTKSALVESEAASSSAALPRKKWREPSRAAVSMSLRAQQETSGSKRRLAQDLYRIMNQDTEEAGFSLAPQTEDSMEKWTIKLFQFDPDSNLAKDMLVVGIDHIKLEMKFPEQYPFEPPFVRVVNPRFKRQTGFVMNGALCMELLTKDGWNPINDIESVIVSVRSLLVVGDGRLQAATDLSKTRYDTLLATAQQEKQNGGTGEPEKKKARTDGDEKKKSGIPRSQVGSYTATEAQSAYSHLSDYHKKKGWDTSGWWARKG